MEFVELIKAPTVDKVVLKRPLHENIEGTLCITSHHVILSSRRVDTQELWVLHRNIDVVERKPLQTGGGSVILKCKDFSIVQLEVILTEDLNNIADSIEALSNIDNPTLQYAFFYRPMYKVKEDGWSAYTTESEFAKLVLKSDEWRLSSVNKDYRICDSYPALVAVPKSISDDTIRSAAGFRQGGRFPLLCYRHDTGAVLLRSGQPLVGPSGKRCRDDEKLINAVLGPGKRGYIIETRSQTLAQTAKSRGGGFELDVHYPQWRRIHKPIERHHTLLESLAKLMEACNDTSSSMDKWLSRLEGSNWLSHIGDTLNCACLVAQCLDQEKLSVLVHGTDGTDLTLAVTSVAQVILNPDCRTVRGFEALIEREWLQGGYPFSSRHSRSCYFFSAAASNAKNPKKKYACTFLLFIDCVWQLFSQFTWSFEFSEDFLITLLEHSYASQFGTFLGDNVREREHMKLSSTTISLWSHLNRPEVLQTYLNPVYEPNPDVIWPSVAPVSLNLWSGLYLRWIINQAPAKAQWTAITQLRDKERELKRQALVLRKKLLSLEDDPTTKFSHLSCTSASNS